jgi:hypothetical protein
MEKEMRDKRLEMKDTKRGKRMMNGLEQVGMGAGAVERYRALAKTVNQYPIALDMTIYIILKAAGKAMRAAMCRKGLLVNQQRHNLQVIVFLEQVGVNRFKHTLAVQSVKELFKRMEPVCRNFTPRHSVALRDGGQGFGVGYVYFATFGAYIPVSPDFYNHWSVFYVTHIEPPVLSIGEMAA